MPDVRFVPGPDQGDAEFIVLAVELHKELLVVDIATTKPFPEEFAGSRAAEEFPSVMVEDDLGNTYRGKGLGNYGASWSGNAPARHFAMAFRPAAPAEARHLRITFGVKIGRNRRVVVML
jgi:hypothetical protein